MNFVKNARCEARRKRRRRRTESTMTEPQRLRNEADGGISQNSPVRWDIVVADEKSRRFAKRLRERLRRVGDILRLDGKKEDEKLGIVRGKISEERMEIAVCVISAASQGDLRRACFRRNAVSFLLELALDERVVDDLDEHLGDGIGALRRKDASLILLPCFALHTALETDLIGHMRTHHRAVISKARKRARHGDGRHRDALPERR